MKFNRFVAFCAALLLAPWFIQAQSALESKPAAELAKGDPRDKLIVASLARIIDEVHLTRHKLDESISERMHRLFVEQWDTRKFIFLESETNFGTWRLAE